MNIHFPRRFRRPHPTLYKIWLENDGKPMPSDYPHLLNQNKPKGCPAILWTSQDDTRKLLAKYRERFPIIYELYWSPHTRPVSRSDILRLLLVYDQPCIYSDHDIVWSRKLPPIRHDIVFWTEFVHSDATVRENMATTREFRGEVPEYNVRIANYVYWTRKPHSAIIARCLRRIQERLGRFADVTLSDYGVLWATAGDPITDTVVEGLPDPGLLKPPQKCEKENVEWVDREGEHVLLMGRIPGQKVAFHQVHGQWRS
jgi:hypothetical protein